MAKLTKNKVEIETQAVQREDDRAWNAVKVTTPDISVFVTAGNVDCSDVEFCIHHLIIRVRELEADKKRHEALAAHVDRLNSRANAVFAANNVSAIAGMKQLLQVVDESPTISLEKFKSESQAEGFENAAKHLQANKADWADQARMELEHRARLLRSQAEGAA